MRNIEPLVIPMDGFCIFSGAFTKEDCDKIKDIGELFEFNKATIGMQSDAKEDREYRDTDITWIEPQEDFKWIFERMHEVIQQVNFDKFQMDLSRFDGFQYSKYKVDGHYDWHTDQEVKPRGGIFRKLSCVLALTEPDEYDGGDLLMCVTGNNDNSAHIRPIKGDLVVFYSHIPHKVEPVTKGTRKTLVTWAMGAKIK